MLNCDENGLFCSKSVPERPDKDFDWRIMHIRSGSGASAPVQKAGGWYFAGEYGCGDWPRHGADAGYVADGRGFRRRSGGFIAGGVRTICKSRMEDRRCNRDSRAGGPGFAAAVSKKQAIYLSEISLTAPPHEFCREIQVLAAHGYLAVFDGIGYQAKCILAVGAGQHRFWLES